LVCITEESAVIPIRTFAAAMLLSTTLAQAAQPELSPEDKQDHEALRALLATFTEAFNTRNLDPLLPHLHPQFTVTMVNQDVVTSPGELKGYLAQQFDGPDALLTDVKIKPDADVLTAFVDGRIGINRGSSVDTYTLKDGRVVTLNTRWTGTAIKDGGQWKILNAHIGLNAIDNPILDGMEKLKWLWTGGALAVGLVAGFLLAWMVKKR
jgi:ketosteroid isomerase-like protein